jgi:hypothetical protein
MASLFGPTPAEIMMARQKEQQQLNMMRQQQISQEGGQFGVFAPLYQAGLRFGDVGAQAMRQRMFPEQVDPMLQKATAIQGVLAKYQGQDLNSAETMTSIAKELSLVDPEAGLKAAEMARKLQGDSPFAKIDPSKFTKESLTAFVEGGAKDISLLDSIEKPVKGTKVGYTEKTREIIYSDGQDQYVIREGQKVPYTGAVAETGGTKIDLNLGQLLNEISTKEDAKAQSAAWGEAGKKYRDNNQVINTLKEFKTIAPEAFTGAGANQKKALSKLFAAAGISISPKASNSELLEAFKSQFVQKIAKNFPGSQALKELEQLILSQPNITQELPTINRLIDRATDEILAEQITYKQLSNLPATERYRTNANILSVENANKIQELRTIESKVQNKTASKVEAERALAIKRELGI